MTLPTQPREQTAGGPRRPPAPHATRRGLAGDLVRLGRIDDPRAGRSAASVAYGYEKVWRITDQWLPLAGQRRWAAASSSADQARWDGLIKAAAHPGTRVRHPSFTGLVELTAHARELLRALRDTEPPYVPVAEVAARISAAVENGNYLAGATISPGRIAADLCLPLASVRLALADLAEKQVVEVTATGRFRVSGPGHLDRPRQIADWLNELIAAGAYPPGTQLPVRATLARNLVSVEPPIAVAIRILVDDGTLICYPGKRPLVRPDLPNAGTKATELLRAFAEHPSPTGQVDLTDTGVRETVRVAQSWWKARVAPDPATLDHHITQLVAIARHLIERARAQPRGGQTGQLDSVIARITAGAAGAARAAPEHRVWRTALLAAAVRDLLKLTTGTGGGG